MALDAEAAWAEGRLFASRQPGASDVFIGIRSLRDPRALRRNPGVVVERCTIPAIRQGQSPETAVQHIDQVLETGTWTDSRHSARGTGLACASYILQTHFSLNPCEVANMFGIDTSEAASLYAGMSQRLRGKDLTLSRRVSKAEAIIALWNQQLAAQPGVVIYGREGLAAYRTVNLPSEENVVDESTRYVDDQMRSEYAPFIPSVTGQLF